MVTQKLEKSKVENAKENYIVLKSELRDIHSKIEHANVRRKETEGDLPGLKNEINRRDEDLRNAIEEYALDKAARPLMDEAREGMDRAVMSVRNEEATIKGLDLNVQKMQADCRELDRKINGARHHFWYEIYQKLKTEVRAKVMDSINECNAAQCLGGFGNFVGMLPDIFGPESADAIREKQEGLRRKYFPDGG